MKNTFVITGVITGSLILGCAHPTGSRKIATEPSPNEKQTVTMEYTLPKGMGSGISIEVFSLTKVSGPKTTDLAFGSNWWPSEPKFSVGDSAVRCGWRENWQDRVDRFGTGGYVDSLFCSPTALLDAPKTFTVTFELAPFSLSEEELAARRKLVDHLQIRQRLNDGIYDRSFFLAAEHLGVLQRSAISSGRGGTGDTSFLVDHVIRIDEVSGSSRVGLFGKKVDASGLAGEKEKRALIPFLPIRKRWPDLKERPYAVLCKAGDRVVSSSARPSSQGFLLKAGEKFQCVINAPQKGLSLSKVRDADLTVHYSIVALDQVKASIRALDSAMKEEREARLTAIERAFRANKGEVYEPSLKVLKNRIKLNQKWSEFSGLIPATLSVESETGFLLARQSLVKSDETGLDGKPVSYVDFSLGVGSSDWLTAYIRNDHAVGEDSGVFRRAAARPVATLDAKGYHLIAVPNDVSPASVQTRTRYEDSVVRAEDGVLRTFCPSEIETLESELSAAAAVQATGERPALQDLLAILDRFDHAARGQKTIAQALQECAALGSGITKTSMSLNGARFIGGLKARSELSGREMADFLSLVPRRIELVYKFLDAADGAFGMVVPVMPDQAGPFGFLSGSIDSQVRLADLPDAMRSNLGGLEWAKDEKDHDFFYYDYSKTRSGMEIFEKPFQAIVGRDNIDLGWIQENLK